MNMYQEINTNWAKEDIFYPEPFGSSEVRGIRATNTGRLIPVLFVSSDYLILKMSHDGRPIANRYTPESEQLWDSIVECCQSFYHGTTQQFLPYSPPSKQDSVPTRYKPLSASLTDDYTHSCPF